MQFMQFFLQHIGYFSPMKANCVLFVKMNKQNTPKNHKELAMGWLGLEDSGDILHPSSSYLAGGLSEWP